MKASTATEKKKEYCTFCLLFPIKETKAFIFSCRASGRKKKSTITTDKIKENSLKHDNTSAQKNPHNNHIFSDIFPNNQILLLVNGIS